MSIFTVGASGLGFVKSAGSSSWDSSGAMQGAYGTGSPRVGALFFTGLNGVSWPDQSVSEIQLTLTFSSAGRSAGKNIGLYTATKTGLWGTGSAMLGAYLGEVWSGTPAYNSTKTIVFNSGSYPEIFAALQNWLNSGVHGLAIYRNETTGSGDNYSSNYLKITGASVSVTYDALGSKGTLDRDSVGPGDTLTLTIEPAALDGTVSHAVEWTLGSATSGVQTLPGGVLQTSFTVPENWLYQLPDAVSGAASCVLTTYLDGVQKAVRSVPFTVNVPASVVPQFMLYADPVGTSGGFWQHLGGAWLTIPDAASAYGATITAYRITGSEGFAADASEAETPVFAESGVHVYTAAVTDSRGRTAERTLEIDVSPLAAPAISAFTVERYDAYVNDSGQTVYEANPRGTHVWVTVRASIDPAGGNNAPTAFIEANGTQIALPWTSGAAYETANDRTLLTSEYDLSDAYGFTLTVSDRHSTVTAFSRVEKGTAIMDVEPDGVAFGGFSTATPDDPKDEFFRKTVFHGGVEGLGVNFSETPELTGGTWFDGKPIWRVCKYYQNLPFGGVNQWTSVGVMPIEAASSQYNLIDFDLKVYFNSVFSGGRNCVWYQLPVMGTNGAIASPWMGDGNTINFNWVNTSAKPFDRFDALLVIYFTRND